MTLSVSGKERLKNGAATLGCELTTGDIERFDTYLALVEETNAHTNLTRVIGDESVEMHFLDALAIVRAVDLKTVQSLVDIGTGMGVPGIPLKIVFPHLHLMLIDSSQKRVGFLNTVIGKLSLENTQTMHARAEDAGRDERLRGQFDCAVARAVAGMSVVGEYCAPLVNVGGSVALYKAHMDSFERELGERRFAELGLTKARHVTVEIPGSEATRTLVVATREKACPERFPRSAKILMKEQDQIREKIQTRAG